MHIIAIIIVLLISIAVLQSLFSSPVFWVLVCVFAVAIGGLLIKDKIEKKSNDNIAENPVSKANSTSVHTNSHASKSKTDAENYVQTDSFYAEQEKDEYKLNLDLLDQNQISPQKTKQEVETEKYIQTDSFYTKVAGVSFGNTQSILPRLSRGMPLEFFREPTNPYDSDAIRIECQGKAIGHLPAHVAVQLAPRIDSGKTYITGKIKEITGGGSKEYYGCNIEVFVWENQSEKIHR